MTDFTKALSVQVSLLALQFAVYFGTQYIEGEPHLIGNSIDKSIPYVPVFIYPYVTWFVMLATMALLLFMFNRIAFARYTMAMVVGIVVCGIVYMIYPTTLERPEAPDAGFTGWLIDKVYSGDYRNVNCLPSLHCMTSFLFIFGALSATAMPAPIKAGVVVMSLLIVAATLLVKQHVVIDVVTALALAGITWWLSGVIGAEKFLQLIRMN